jgi:hypothetical protein
MYLDVDTSYGSPSYGNIHVYQKALAPQGIREVNYVDIPEVWLTEIEGSTISAAAVSSQKGNDRS